MMTLKAQGKNFLALGMGLLLLLLLEGILALCRVEPIAAQDPFVGFAGSSPLFVEDRPGHFALNPARSTYFNAPQGFAMPKPAGTFRIVVLGGSTTYGRPYLHRTSFGAWMEKLIERYAGEGDVEVINAGGISYASYRVRRLMDELADYQPDLFVVYSGHNEFLEARTFAELRNEPEGLRRIRGLAHHSRLYSLLARSLGKVAGPGAGPTQLGDEITATLERIGGAELYHRDAKFREGVIRQYRHEVESMVRFCRERDIPLVLATLPVNLSGISPFKSEHAAGLDGEALSRWQSAYDRGLAALADNQPQQALGALAEAEALDAGYAELHFRKGQAYAQLGDAQQAYQSFDRARQEDIVPLRAINEFNEALRAVADREQVALADVEKFYLRISPDGIPGNNLFADHVHPTIEGQQLVAWVILNAATTANLVPLDASAWQKAMPLAREYLRLELSAIPERYQAMGLWGVGRLYFWAGKYPEAYVALRQAWLSVRDIPELARQLGELELVRGDAAAALGYLDAAERLAPGDLKVVLARASALNRLGRAGSALTLLHDLKVPENEQAAGVYHVMGETLLQLGRTAEAIDQYRRAIAVAPDVTAYRLTLAEAYKRFGDVEAARAAYDDYLVRLPNPALATPIGNWLERP